MGGLFRISAVLGLLGALAGCVDNTKLREERSLGAFELGFPVVVAKNATPIPGTRSVSTEAIADSLTSEINRRLGRYEGGRLYHIGVNVQGYLLAPPGVPVLLSPKSVLVISVSVWDDTLGERVSPGTKQFTVLESFTGESAVGSGLTMTADEQLLNLAQNAASQIEDWLAQNPEWFDYPVAPRVEEETPFGVTPTTGLGSIEPAEAEALRPDVPDGLVAPDT